MENGAIKVGAILRNGGFAFRVIEVGLSGGPWTDGVPMLHLQALKKDGSDAQRRPRWVPAAQWLQAIESGRVTVEEPKAAS